MHFRPERESIFLFFVFVTALLTCTFYCGRSNEIEMPNFNADLLNSTENTVSFNLSYDPLSSKSSASFYEIVVMKINTDVNGKPRRPMTTNPDPIFGNRIKFSSYRVGSPSLLPYIAARYPATALPSQITIGDGKVRELYLFMSSTYNSDI